MQAVVAMVRVLRYSFGNRTIAVQDRWIATIRCPVPCSGRQPPAHVPSRLCIGPASFLQAGGARVCMLLSRRLVLR